MPAESKRGCGYRKVGSLYLVGSGGMVSVCDFLPLKLEPCPHCGFEIPKHEGFMWIAKQYFIAAARPHQGGIVANHKVIHECKCPPGCPVCHPDNIELAKYGLMWVGNKFYTPETFVKEALTMGISKKISEIPKDLVLGETWVMLAHRKTPFTKQYRWAELQEEPEFKPAIFYAFRPARVEMPIWKREATPQRIRELEDQGITPVFFEGSWENELLHTRKIKRR